MTVEPNEPQLGERLALEPRTPGRAIPPGGTQQPAREPTSRSPRRPGSGMPGSLGPRRSGACSDATVTAPSSTRWPNEQLPYWTAKWAWAEREARPPLFEGYDWLIDNGLLGIEAGDLTVYFADDGRHFKDKEGGHQLPRLAEAQQMLSQRGSSKSASVERWKGSATSRCGHHRRSTRASSRSSARRAPAPTRFCGLGGFRRRGELLRRARASRTAVRNFVPGTFRCSGHMGRRRTRPHNVRQQAPWVHSVPRSRGVRGRGPAAPAV